MVVCIYVQQITSTAQLWFYEKVTHANKVLTACNRR